MKCPNCGEEMEREDHVELPGLFSKIKKKELNYSVYSCPSCDLEAYWDPSNGLQISLEPWDSTQGS